MYQYFEMSHLKFVMQNMQLSWRVFFGLCVCEAYLCPASAQISIQRHKDQHTQKETPPVEKVCSPTVRAPFFASWSWSNIDDTAPIKNTRTIIAGMITDIDAYESPSTTLTMSESSVSVETHLCYPVGRFPFLFVL